MDSVDGSDGDDKRKAVFVECVDSSQVYSFLFSPSLPSSFPFFSPQEKKSILAFIFSVPNSINEVKPIQFQTESPNFVQIFLCPHGIDVRTITTLKKENIYGLIYVHDDGYYGVG